MKKFTYRRIIGLLPILLATILSGCSKTVYVPVESKKVEYRDKMLYDSIHIMDSIYIREKGDTIWLTKWRIEYRDRIMTDSVIIRDSIQVPYPVERSLSKWQQTKMDIGGIAIGGLIAVICGIIIWIIVSLCKK